MSPYVSILHAGMAPVGMILFNPRNLSILRRRAGRFARTRPVGKRRPVLVARLHALGRQRAGGAIQVELVSSRRMSQWPIVQE